MDIIDAIITVIAIALGIFASDIIAQRYCLRKLKKANAISPESAVTPEEAKIDLGPMTESALRRLIRHETVKKTEDGRYYVQH